MNNRRRLNTFIRLAALAEITGLSVHSIRNYVDQGLIEVADRTKGGFLLFFEPAIERLQFIKIARDAGVPLAKIVCLLSTCDQGDDEGTQTRLFELNQYIEDTRRKISQFEQSLLTFGMINQLNSEVIQ